MSEKCRICMAEKCNLECINISNKLNEESTVLDGIVTISSVEISEEDALPQSICSQCYIKLDQLYIFRTLIISSDKALKQQLQNAENDLKVCERELNGTNNINHVSPNEENAETVLIESKDEVKMELDTRSVGNYKLDVAATIKPRRKCRIKKSHPEKKHECLECGRSFKKVDHLNVHVAYKHLEKQFMCNICNKKFARKYDLTYHSRIHTGERPFTCELCGKSFASSSYFYMHKRMHTGHRKMKCDLCQNSFINSDQLQIHIRQKHTGERPFLCELCSHSFTSSSALFRHKRDVHDQKVECPTCLKLYSSRVLKDHLKRHKEKEEGIKRFSCNLCGKKFTCATSRKRHLVIHSGEKAFKCEVCEKSFNQRSTLQTHMRIHSQIMPFQCDICSKTFRYKHHLKLHCEKLHKNVLPPCHL